jgi:regulator of sirC expression with transglutaminase-like and TPR domain
MSTEDDIETDSGTAGNTPRTRTEALIHLLGDEDIDIRSEVWGHLEKLGKEALESAEAAAAASDDPEVKRQAGRFALEFHRREVFKEWLQFCRGPAPDLETGSLLIARSEYPELDPGACSRALDEFAVALESRSETAAGVDARLASLVELLSKEAGFKGNEEGYYEADNSYLNRILETKLGIPISLSVLYLLVARRCGLPLHGVALPGHFILKFDSAETGKQAEMFLDPFHGGRLLNVRECVELLESSGESFRAELLEAVDDRVILCRMLGNLLNVYHGGSDRRRMNRVAAMLKLLQDPRD